MSSTENLSGERIEHYGDIVLKDITKEFERGVAAVDCIDLEILEKELLVFLGPSGCGKSTTLYMLAGLERPTSGEIYFGNQLMTDVPPEQRDISMVFQSFGLYPHLKARENITFPLKLARVEKNIIDQRVSDITQLLGIDNLLKRRLNELSGGERQRVAIAKALVKRPRLFLLDEPFSNLDAEMRRELRGELVRIHAELETTTIFVTHDQEEAMAVADRVAIMKSGKIIQVGAPLDLYNRPKNMWIAQFVGSHPINLIDLFIEDNHNNVVLFSDGGIRTEVPSEFYQDIRRRSTKKNLVLGIRPEFMRLRTGITGKGHLLASVYTRQVLGNQILYELMVGSDLVRSVIPSTENYLVGDEVFIEFAWSHALTFDKETGECLLD
jgi:ABC-type sugar transport system ATPase subunit